MTTYFDPEKVICGICGTTNWVAFLSSTNTFGGFHDLDGRPPEMERSTIKSWINRCQGCGYCAPDLTYAPERARDIIESNEYQALLKNSKLESKAREFLCLSLLAKEHGNFVDAAFACIHAAWVCDDAGDDAAARVCRRQAASLMDRLRMHRPEALPSDGSFEVVHADLLRRTGVFEEALGAIDRGIVRQPEENVRKTLEFERVLINAGDMGLHNFEEVDKWDIELGQEPNRAEPV